MTNPDQLGGIHDFARAYIRGTEHYSNVHTEHLAEALRGFGGLPPFPSLAQLRAFCHRLGISLKSLPPVVDGLDGANLWVVGRPPEIYMRDDLLQMRAETTICHEIREVIENAFKHENPSYHGLETSDNRLMNPESDHFASCLLMQAVASRQLLLDLGFDLKRFSQRTGRSLPSVVLRLQSLYSIKSGEERPTACVWLFDSPWKLVRAGTVDYGSMVARYQAQMCGFSMRKGSSSDAILRRKFFPAKGSSLLEFPFGQIAIENHFPLMAELKGFDMFEEHDYQLIAEPIFARDEPWRLVVIAARKDALPLFEGWLNRLDVRPSVSVHGELMSERQLSRS